MATVYLATDREQGDRRVAIKVLRPELGAALGADRFLREIRLTANLQHPHILPLFHSGSADSLLYYVMPWVEGESLSARLAREKQLPIDEAVRITTEIAHALGYAHARGIVHRDVKPGNILLSGGQAMLADFGIARALAEAGGEALTSTGLGLGTPAYMSPEQALDEKTIDGRSDIYSLGCVLYEMLVGDPPFTGSTAQAIVARKSAESAPSLRTVRDTVPPALDRAVLRAVARVPADRFPTAGAFAAALAEPGHWTRPRVHRWRTGALAASVARTLRARWQVVLGVLLASGVVVAQSMLTMGRPQSATDPKVLAIVPFRVTGADSSLSYLREGMLDLLAAKLSGTSDLRTVAPRTLLHAWRQAGGSMEADLEPGGAVTLMRQLGAGRLLEGEVIGTTARLVLNATLIDARGVGQVLATVEGSSDSLAFLVDRLAAQLLVQAAGEPQHRLAALTTTSLPALRNYLDGMGAHRRGNYTTARDFFDRALAHDSSFALAALRRARAGMWLDESAGRDIAWRHRDRLSKRDLLLLYSMLGPRYPIGSVREDLDNAEALVAETPDDPEAWAELGDRHFHYSAMAGVSDAHERSLRAYERAVRLDSTYSPSLEHLYELHYALGDTAASRRTLRLLLRGKPLDTQPNARWFARICLGDSSIKPFADSSLAATSWIALNLALRYTRGLAEAESVLSHRSGAVANDAERRRLQERWWSFYVIRGKPRRALTWQADATDPVHRAGMILDAIYAGADMAQAGRLAKGMSAEFAPPELGARWESIVEQYARAQYDLTTGQLKPAKGAVRAWWGVWVPGDTSQALRLASHLALLLEAQLAALEDRSDALARLSELDSVLVDAPTGGAWIPTETTSGGFEHIGNLVAARLWNDRGEPDRALAAVRRRPYGFMPPTVFISQLRDEGRYAALAGDRQGALRAYSHYLKLRSEPEPSIIPEVAQVRAEAADLEHQTMQD